MQADEFTSKWIDAGADFGIDLAGDDALVMFKNPDGSMLEVTDIQVEYHEDTGGHTVWITGEEY